MWIWLGRAGAATIVGGLGLYMVVVGLDDADKIGSSVAALVAVLVLVAPHLVSDRSVRSDGLAQSVSDTVVIGNLSQTRDVGGPVRSSKEGQWINGVWVGGNVTQIGGVAGDVSLE